MFDSVSAISKRTDPSMLLVGGVISSIAASICCIGPMLLLAIGISGSWMSRLMVLESHFLALASMSLALIGTAGWKLVNPRPCDAGDVEGGLKPPESKSLLPFILALCLALILLTSEYWIVSLAA